MLKSITAAVVAAAALVLSPGVAHADAVDDEINSYAFIAGMPGYLHTLRGIYPSMPVDEVAYEVAASGFYCWPTGGFATIPRAQWRSLIGGTIHDNAVEFGASESAIAAQMTALNAYCAAYPTSPFPA